MTGDISKGPPAARSVSQYEKYLRCPEQYRLRYVERVQERPAAWLFEGTAAHEAVEVWERSQGQISPDEMDLIFLNHYDSALERAKEKEPDLNRWMTGGRTKATTDIDNRRERGLAKVRSYRTWRAGRSERPLDLGEGEPAVELEFEITLGDVKIRGVIDQVNEWPDGQITVRDLKFGNRRPSSAFQLGVYRLAVEDELKLSVDYGDFYMGKDATLLTPEYLPVTWSRPRLTQWFANVDRGITTGVFAPHPGEACNTCGVSDHCPIMGLKNQEG